jgi:EAL domain-containing protein (putative c-di-GMP-specific phosphodiesterase class I)
MPEAAKVYFRGISRRVTELRFRVQEHNHQSAAIVRAVVSLAHALGLPVIAEGVESSAQLEFLTRETVDEVQGYLLGRPYPIKHYAEPMGHPVDATKSANRAS